MTATTTTPGPVATAGPSGPPLPGARGPLSTAVLDRLPGLELDAADVAAVLAAADPVSAGIDRAVAEAIALLAVDGVDGVNLSGSASAAGVAYAAEIQAEVGRRIQEGTT